MIKTHNRTKIIATVGPACNSYNQLIELVKAGVDLFRFNFSHGTHEEHKEALDCVHKINRAYRLNIGILADLQGPKIRIGDVEDGSVELIDDAAVKITTKKCVSTADEIYVSYEALAEDVSIGDKILIDDGKICLEVIFTDKKELINAKVINGGMLYPRKGVNLPNTNISTPSVTDKDWKDLAFALKNKANWIALSFVRKPDDIKQVKKKVGRNKAVKIIAKIEKPEAVEHLDAIIAVSDGLMVARGDLGVEIPIEQMPFIQKEIVRKSIVAGKPVIIATQIMETMMENPYPTRAEANDVANGLVDGADALMLSGETSVGKYPVEVVQIISKIMAQVETQEEIYNKNLTPSRSSRSFLSDAICYNACKIASEVKAKAIIGMTHSGGTAFMLASYRPKAKIYIFTDNEDLLNTLSLFWGVQAFFYDQFASTDDSINDVIDILKHRRLIDKGDVVINTGSMPINSRSRTNMLKITVVE